MFSSKWWYEDLILNNVVFLKLRVVLAREMLFFVLFLANSVVDLYVMLFLSKTYVWSTGQFKRLGYIKLFVVAHNIHSVVAYLVNLRNFALKNVSTFSAEKKTPWIVVQQSPLLQKVTTTLSSTMLLGKQVKDFLSNSTCLRILKKPAENSSWDNKVKTNIKQKPVWPH